MLDKLCKKCKQIKSCDVINFKKDKRTKDGFCHWCRACSNEYHRQWKHAHKSKVREQNAEYRRTHQKSIKEYNAEYRETHKEELAQYNAEYYKEHPEEYKERLNNWRNENPERAKLQIHNRRTRKTQAGGEFTEKEWLDICNKYGNKCLCCGNNSKLVPDHIIPVSKGGTSNIDNIQPLCGPCNSKKAARTIDYRPKEIAWQNAR